VVTTYQISQNGYEEIVKGGKEKKRECLDPIQAFGGKKKKEDAFNVVREKKLLRRKGKGSALRGEEGRTEIGFGIRPRRKGKGEGLSSFRLKEKKKGGAQCQC